MHGRHSRLYRHLRPERDALLPLLGRGAHRLSAFGRSLPEVRFQAASDLLLGHSGHRALAAQGQEHRVPGQDHPPKKLLCLLEQLLLAHRPRYSNMIYCFVALPAPNNLQSRWRWLPSSSTAGNAHGPVIHLLFGTRFTLRRILQSFSPTSTLSVRMYLIR